MQLTLHQNQPMHDVLAKFSSARGEHPRRVIGRLLPGLGAVSFSYVLPIHLETLARNIPSGLGLSAEVIIERHTFFPALAPFLELKERSAVAAKMAGHGHVAPFPICQRARVRVESAQIRGCPDCARSDREEGFVPVARARMPHQLWGVRACWLHGCELVELGEGFGDPRALHDIQNLISDPSPAAIAADVRDVELAGDLASLFSAGCPRPGRLAIAWELSRAARAAGFVRGPSRMMAVGELLAAFEKHYGRDWLDARGIDRPTNTNSWPRNCMSDRPEIYPAMLIAAMGRFLGRPLPALLAKAENVGGGPGAPPPSMSANKIHFSKSGAAEIDDAKARVKMLISENPGVSRSRLRGKDQYAFAMLGVADPGWLAEHLPAKRRRTGICQDWTETDEALAAKVSEASQRLRLSQTKPVQITVSMLLGEVGGMRYIGTKWHPKLPLLHAALREMAEPAFDYTARRCAWLLTEIASGRQRPTQGIDVFLKRSGLAHLALKHPEIRDQVRSRMSGVIQGRGQ